MNVKELKEIVCELQCDEAQVVFRSYEGQDEDAESSIKNIIDINQSFLKHKIVEFRLVE